LSGICFLMGLFSSVNFVKGITAGEKP
jgi:hypothetical protein